MKRRFHDTSIIASVMVALLTISSTKVAACMDPAWEMSIFLPELPLDSMSETVVAKVIIRERNSSWTTWSFEVIDVIKGVDVGAVLQATTRSTSCTSYWADIGDTAFIAGELSPEGTFVGNWMNWSEPSAARRVKYFD